MSPNLLPLSDRYWLNCSTSKCSKLSVQIMIKLLLSKLRRKLSAGDGIFDFTSLIQPFCQCVIINKESNIWESLYPQFNETTYMYLCAKFTQAQKDEAVCLLITYRINSIYLDYRKLLRSSELSSESYFAVLIRCSIIGKMKKGLIWIQRTTFRALCFPFPLIEDQAALAFLWVRGKLII